MVIAVARFLVAAFGLCLCVHCGGCSVPSLNSLATPETTVFEPSLIGDWVQESRAEDALRVRVSKGEANLYSVVLNPEVVGAPKSRDGDDGPVNLKLTGALVKLGDHRFIDLTLSEDGRKALGNQYALLAVPVHQIFKVSIEQDRLKVWDLDDEWLKSVLAQNSAAIEHCMVEGDSPVITAPTAALQKFIAAHAAEEKPWTDAQVYVRTKTATPAKP